jgi:choline dehydrogenase-like flavoprotein
MADTYDIIIVGAGSGGGFISGEIAANASVLILEAGPHITGDAMPGFGAPNRRRYSTQVNLGQYIPDGTSSNRGDTFYSYPMYMDESNPAGASVQREPRVVGGGSFINVGAWLRPTLVDWQGFIDETGVQGWTKAAFEPHFQRGERILHVHRDVRENWNKASVYYEATALRMGIPIFETASNRFHCLFCGHRLDAGMPCKYDALQSTAITQIPKAMKAGATLLDNATAVRIEISNNTATGVTYKRNGETITANARKLVIASSGAIGTPLLLRDSDVHLKNPNVGNYLRAHPGAPIDVLLPGEDWNMDRGYQWNVHHFVMDKNGEPLDALVHASASFPSTTPWVAAAFQIGLFGKPYKDIMRRFPQRSGAFIFTLKPAIYGRVIGTIDAPVIYYPIADTSGLLEPKTLNDLTSGVRQVASVYQQFGAITSFPNPYAPKSVLESGVSLFVTTSGALHPQGTCRAGSQQSNSVVDTNGMSWDIKNLMCCDASVIPNHISANPHATIIAAASRAADFVNTQILGVRNASTAEKELEQQLAAAAGASK